jgi:capsular polysaccharide biosynthesis protein/MinD-like ATPase involved in chromosome partitioning or flagellar assembly
MDANRPISVDTSESRGVDLLGMARRHWWLAVSLVVLGILGAAQFTRMEPKVFESSTSVLVQPSGTDTNVVGGRTKGDINLDTEAQLVRSTAVASNAAKLLQSKQAPEELAANVSVEVPANTSVLVITYAAPDAAAARNGSHAFAASYLQNRDESARADITGQIGTLTTKLAQLNAQRSQVNRMLAPLRQSDPNRANLENQRSTVSAQIDSLTSRLNQLTTTTLSSGRIIRDAELPARPSKPNQPLNLASGAMVGLILGVGAAMLRERLDKRVRRAGDLPRRVDMAVLAAVPTRVRPRLDDVFAPFGTGGRIFNRLRNEVLASVPAPAGVDARAALCGQVVVVTGASRGAASTVVATNLAAAFARTSAETVLVSAHLPDSIVETASMNRMLGVRTMPGLSDVLAGRVSLGTATQRAPRHPNLNVITTGGTASAGGLLQSQSLRDTLAMLRERAAYIVIEAPSTATSADAQSLASLADAAIVAVELRRTTYEEVIDAADQLRRVGTPLLGSVVLPRLAGARPDENPPAEPPLPNDMTAVLEAIAESGAANDETIVTTRIRTSHQTSPSQPRRRPKASPPTANPPKTVPVVIERTGDRKVVERSVAERLMSEQKDDAEPAADETPDVPSNSAETH